MVFVKLDLEARVQVIGHVEDVLWQLLQLQVALARLISHLHLVVRAFACLDNLIELARVHISQIPLLYQMLADMRVRVVVCDENVFGFLLLIGNEGVDRAFPD